MRQGDFLIIDVPTAEDFRSQGLVFLNLAWDAVVALYSVLDEAGFKEIDDDGQLSTEYWSAAQRPLATALTLLGQGSEFLLKAEIAETSPYLLLFGGPRDWPGGAQDADTPFARFRTVDAHDLAKIHDVVRPIKLDPAFRKLLADVRERRNAIMHTIDKNARITPREMVVNILEIAHHLVGPQKWVDTRWEYHEETPASVAHSTDHVDYAINSEMLVAVEALTPAEVARYFGFDKKQRRYICSRCAYAIDDPDRARTAILHTHGPGSMNVRCFVCRKGEEVRREDCPEDACPGSVIGVASGACLTCFGKLEPN